MPVCSHSLWLLLQNPKTLLRPYKEALGLSPPSTPQWQETPNAAVFLKLVMVPSHLRLLTPATLPSNQASHTCLPANLNVPSNL